LQQYCIINNSTLQNFTSFANHNQQLCENCQAAQFCRQNAGTLEQLVNDIYTT